MGTGTLLEVSNIIPFCCRTLNLAVIIDRFSKVLYIAFSVNILFSAGEIGQHMAGFFMTPYKKRDKVYLGVWMKYVTLGLQNASCSEKTPRYPSFMGVETPSYLSFIAVTCLT